MIDRARHSIDLCTFHFGRDAVGEAIARRLMQRAQEGIAVRLLIDGIGAYLGRRPNVERMTASGMQVALFVPPLRSALRGRTNLRNHRKLVITDRQRLWCGGRNLAAAYFQSDQQSRTPERQWIDLSFDLQGSLAAQAQQQFDQDWSFATRETAVCAPRHVAPAPATSLWKGQIIASGPDQLDDTIYTLIVSGCFAARTRITAVTPYFVPEPTLLMALTMAARRGVTVDLLIPRRSNHRLADIARHAALRELTAAGGHVWLAPGMIHAKAVIIDKGLALVGSANLDERSLFLNYELMVAFYDASIVQQFSDWISTQQRQASGYESHPPGLALGLIEGLVRWAAFQL
jgi:cardiolipin synthase